MPLTQEDLFLDVHTTAAIHQVPTAPTHAASAPPVSRSRSFFIQNDHGCMMSDTSAHALSRIFVSADISEFTEESVQQEVWSLHGVVAHVLKHSVQCSRFSTC